MDDPDTRVAAPVVALVVPQAGYELPKPLPRQMQILSEAMDGSGGKAKPRGLLGGVALSLGQPTLKTREGKAKRGGYRTLLRPW